MAFGYSKIYTLLLHFWGYFAMLVIVLVCRFYRWVGQWSVFLPWQLAWHLGILCELVFGEEAFRSVTVLVLLSPMSEVCLQQWGLTFKFLEATKGTDSCSGGISWALLTNNSMGEFPKPGTGDIFR